MNTFLETLSFVLVVGSKTVETDPSTLELALAFLFQLDSFMDIRK
jgi:hypothetical protein